MSENKNNNTEEIEEIKETEEIENIEKTEQSPKNEKSSFKDSVLGTAVILGIISVITVFAISLLNLFTSPVIEKKLTDEKNESIKNFFGEEIYYEPFTGLEMPSPATEAIVVYDNLSDDIAGYCVTVEPKGFGGKIIMLVAVNPNITVKDTQILSMSETAGYGTRVNDENWFSEQFIYRTQNIKDIRTAPASGENAVQVIAGATVSSKAFLNGVNTALDVAGIISGQQITEEQEESEELPENGEDTDGEEN